MKQELLRLESAIDHFINPSRRYDPLARADMKRFIIEHLKRGVIDLLDFPVKQTKPTKETDMSDEIKKFNQFVERAISKNGTCKIEHETQGVACFETDGADGFVGWWDNDHSQMTYADTPYQVYCDMP